MITIQILQAIAAFIGVWIGFFFSITGFICIVAAFVNRDKSSGGIVLWGTILWGGLAALGITFVIAILKPI